jgi:hypothetical protein
MRFSTIVTLLGLMAVVVSAEDQRGASSKKMQKVSVKKANNQGCFAFI